MISKIKQKLGIMLVTLIVTGMIPGGFKKVEAVTGTNYYVDSVQGDDNNEGTSENAPWKTLSKMNEATLNAGDKVLLKSGSIWNDEQLKPNGSGVAGNPIILDKYGEGNNPIINTNGKHDFALYLLNKEYWEISNLEITNKGTTEKKGRTGVMVEAHNVGILNHIYLKNLNVHDVNGNSTMKDLGNGGIFYSVTDNGEVVSKFNDVLVEGCTVKNVNRSAISIGGGVWNPKFDGYGGRFPQEVIDTYTHTNVSVRNNYIESVGGDAVVVQYCNKPVIEYNVSNECCVTSNASGQYSAGIWPWRCVDAVFQFNEVYDTKYNGDGMAYDCDYGLRTIYQYNYSHDNEGGFMLMCQNESLDSVVRYNISQNDKVGALSISGTASGDIYNNVMYVGEGVNAKPFRYDWGTGEVGIYNNVFYNAGNEMVGNWMKTAKYSNNAYYGYKNIQGDNPNPLDLNKVTLDPKFVAAGTGEYGLDSVDGYKLQGNSPLIDAGMNIENNGGRDYYGNAVNDGKIDIGAFEANVIVSKVNELSAEKSSNSVKLTWVAPEETVGLREYVIYKSGKEIARISGDINEYEVENLKANTIYGFKVTAKYSNGQESKPKSINVRTSK